MLLNQDRQKKNLPMPVSAGVVNLLGLNGKNLEYPNC
jgi:hypothetical protein